MLHLFSLTHALKSDTFSKEQWTFDLSLSGISYKYLVYLMVNIEPVHKS